jgi:hypothetical protein
MKKININDLWEVMPRVELLHYDIKGSNQIIFEMTDCKRHMITCANMNDRDIIMETLKNYLGVYA